MSDDLTTAIGLLEEAAQQAEATADFFDDLTTGGDTEEVTNPNNNITVPTVRKQISDLYATDDVVAEAQAAKDDAETARDLAQSAQAAAEAAEASTVKISGLDTVYEAIALTSPANIDWDVEIPFNDSLNIERGYGTHDQIDVSAAQDGSVMVDLPTKSVVFSRASSGRNINKSGIYEEVGVDEPAIGSDGLGVFGSYSQLAFYAQSLDNSNWNKQNTSVSQDSVSDPSGGDAAWTLSISSATTFMSLRKISPTIQNNSPHTVSIFAKAGSLSSFSMRMNLSYGVNASITVDLESGSISSSTFTDRYTISSLNDGWYRVSMTATPTDSVGIVEFASFSGMSVDAGDYIYVYTPNLTQSSRIFPVISEDSGLAVTHAPDIVSIPMENNMPAAGKAFTIMVDCAVPEYINGNIGIMRFMGSGSLNMVRRTSAGIQWLWRSADGTDTSISVSGVDAEVHRFAFVFDPDNDIRSIYVDGSFGGSVYYDSSNIGAYDLTSILYLGAVPLFAPYGLNSYIKNLRIIHRALSDEEIKSLGVPK